MKCEQKDYGRTTVIWHNDYWLSQVWQGKKTYNLSSNSCLPREWCSVWVSYLFIILFGRHFTHPFVRNRNKIFILRGRQEFYWRTIRTLKKNKHQNPDVQRVDNAIQRINHYPADNWWQNLLRYPPESDLSSGERYLPFEQPRPGVKMFYKHDGVFSLSLLFIRNCISYSS